MRIIAGQFGGRTLLAPESDKTRPITDRAKQSLFDALQGRMEGGVVLDCFCGTGSMGLECLSRGAKKAVFVERDRRVVEILRKNIAALGVEEMSTVLPIDAYAAGAHPLLIGEGKDKLVLAFVDPPYFHMETGKFRHKADTLVAELAAGALAEEGLIILRHPSRVSVDPEAMGVRVVRELKYGDMGITWLAKA